MNAAVLTGPVSSQAGLAARASRAMASFGGAPRQWFCAGNTQRPGDRSSKTLLGLGLTKAFTVVGIVTEGLTPPARSMPRAIASRD